MERRIPDSLIRMALRGAHLLLRAYGWLFRPRAWGVSVAVWLGPRLLVVRNSYRSDLGLPGGALRRSETLRSAACRELEEEVGVRADPAALRFLGVWRGDYEHKRDCVFRFELRLDAEPQLEVDRREVVWAGFADPGELPRGPLAPVLLSVLDPAQLASARSAQRR